MIEGRFTVPTHLGTEVASILDCLQIQAQHDAIDHTGLRTIIW